MRRVKLIWFALGAATSAIVSFAATWLLQPGLTFSHDWTPYIVLVEPRAETGDDTELVRVADRTGDLLRGCGARVFELTALNADHAPTAEFPLVRENYDALKCVLDEIQARRIRFDVNLRQPPRAADEMRTSR